MSKTKKKYYALNEDVDPQVVFGQIFGACVDDEVIASVVEDLGENAREMFHEASPEEIEEYGTVDNPKEPDDTPSYTVVDGYLSPVSEVYATLEEAMEKMKEMHKADPDRYLRVIDHIGDLYEE